MLQFTPSGTAHHHPKNIQITFFYHKNYFCRHSLSVLIMAEKQRAVLVGIPIHNHRILINCTNTIQASFRVENSIYRHVECKIWNQNLCKTCMKHRNIRSKLFYLFSTHFRLHHVLVWKFIAKTIMHCSSALYPPFQGFHFKRKFAVITLNLFARKTKKTNKWRCKQQNSYLDSDCS